MAAKKNYNKISTEQPIKEEVVKEEQVVTEEPTDEISTLTGVVCNCKKLNVRKKPNLEAKVLCVLDAADEVTIIDGTDTKDFYEIKLNKSTGYCMKKYITIK